MAKMRLPAAVASGSATNMEWQRFNLADVTTEISDTGLNSVTQDTSTGIWTVEIASGATPYIGGGAAWGFNISTGWAWSDLQWAAIAIEKVGGTNLGGSDLYVFGGIATNPDSAFNVSAMAGLQFDASNADNPDVGVHIGYADSSTPNYSAAQAGVKGIFGAFHIGPGDKMLNATASAVSAYGDPDTWKYTKRATASLSIPNLDSAFGFVLACGRNTSNSATATIQFRAHYLLSGKQDVFFKDNDG